MVAQPVHTAVAPNLRAQFERTGYVLAPGLMDPAEVQELIDTMMAIHAGGPIPELNYHPLPPAEAGGDILKQYPRIIHPHKVDETAKRYMIHPKIMASLAELFGEEPLAAQSMMYFKPPGARGQSLHQDNFFLKVEPGTCIAAWVALDAADEENGGLVVVPGTNDMEIVCPHEADQSVFFTNQEVDIPAGLAPVPVNMEAGDVLFFNGSLIHGSYPNQTQDRWRRSFIGHYVGMSTVRLGHFYNELYTASGEMVQREDNYDSGPCGVEGSMAMREPH